MAKQTYTALEDGKLIEKTVPKPQTTNPRSRKFALITYIDRDSVIDFLKHSEWVCHWSLCRHDKDLNTDGSSKKVHTHILLYTYQTKTSSAVERLFNNFSKSIYENTDTAVQNTLVAYCTDMSVQYRYLIHADDIDKAQYEVIERFSDDVHYWTELDKSAGMVSVESNKALAMFDDLLAGTRIRDMLARYGQNFLINYTKLLKMKDDHYYECLYHSTGDNIDDIIRNVLEDAVYPKAVVDGFYMVLDYLRSEIFIKYHNVVDFYLRPSNKQDEIKYYNLKGD